MKKDHIKWSFFITSLGDISNSNIFRLILRNYLEKISNTDKIE
jgi:hypothetical protein